MSLIHDALIGGNIVFMFFLFVLCKDVLMFVHVNMKI